MKAPSTSTNEVDTMKQVENHSVTRGNLKMLYGQSSLSQMKMDNFRELFKEKADYDEIKSIMLSFGDYSLKNGNARNYIKESLVDWRNKIFTNNNIDSSEPMEAALNRKSITDYTTYVTLRDTYLQECSVAKEYPWQYYLSKYKSMRWAPEGRYLLDGSRYLYYMFRASTCILSDNYIHYNVYNDALYVILRDRGEEVEENNRGGALKIKEYNYTIDVKEDKVIITLGDRGVVNYAIPQNNQGYDKTDRVEMTLEIIRILNDIGDNKYSDFNEEELKSLNKELKGEDLKILDWNIEYLETD